MREGITCKNIIFKWILGLIVGVFPQYVHAIRLQLEKNITILQNSQYLIDINFNAKQEDSSQFIFASEISLFRKYPIDSLNFDGFLMKSDQEKKCFNNAIRSYNERECPFLMNEKQTRIRINNFTVSLHPPIDNTPRNYTVVIDNTQFPINGAFFQAFLQLQAIYSIEISSQDPYYFIYYKILIACGIVLFYIVFWTGIMFHEVRIIRRKNNSFNQTCKNNEINVDEKEYRDTSQENSSILTKNGLQKENQRSLSCYQPLPNQFHIGNSSM